LETKGITLNTVYEEIAIIYIKSDTHLLEEFESAPNTCSAIHAYPDRHVPQNPLPKI